MVGMMGASMLLNASQSVKAGREEAYRLELEGKQDEVATIGRETDRKRELAKVLASQNASAGAGGIMAFEGSPLAIMQEDIKLEGEYTEREEYEAGLRHRIRRRAGRNAKDAGYIKAISGLLMSGSSMAGSMGGGGKSMGTSATGSGTKTTSAHVANARVGTGTGTWR
jgi:hypothetical protein